MLTRSDDEKRIAQYKDVERKNLTTVFDQVCRPSGAGNARRRAQLRQVRPERFSYSLDKLMRWPATPKSSGGRN